MRSSIAVRWGEVGGSRPRRNGKREMYPLWQTCIDSSGKGQPVPADLLTFVVHAHVAKHLLLVAPVQICFQRCLGILLTVKVRQDPLLMPGIFIAVVCQVQEVTYLPHRPGKEPHPAHKIEMELPAMRRPGSRIIVQARSQNMIRCSSSPAIRLGPRRRSPSIRLQQATLATSEPKIMAAKGGIEGGQI